MAKGRKPRSKAGAEPVPLYFDGFPYIVTRVVSGLYHIILLPSAIPDEGLLEIARLQAAANALETCLVLGDDRCAHIGRDGGANWSDSVPMGSIWVSDKLQPSVDIKADDELRDRKARLTGFIEARRRSGFLYGNMSKGGRPATAEELQRLSGQAVPGVPKGLVHCEACGEWRGVCLDPNPVFKNKVMTVHCRCQNDNLCARCGRPLNERKLNANEFGADGQIWWTSGFSAFSHRCPDLPPLELGKEEKWTFQFRKRPPREGLSATFEDRERGLLAKLNDPEENHQDARYDLMFLNGSAGREDEAMRWAVEYLVHCRDADDAGAMRYCQGQIMERLEDWEAALAFYREALDLYPRYPFFLYFIHNNLGFTLNQLGRHSEAEPYLRKATWLDPNRANAFKNLGLALEGQGRFADAAWSFISGIRADASDARSLWHLEDLVEKHDELYAEIPDLAYHINKSREAVEYAATRQPDEPGGVN